MEIKSNLRQKSIWFGGSRALNVRKVSFMFILNNPLLKCINYEFRKTFFTTIVLWFSRTKDENAAKFKACVTVTQCLKLKVQGLHFSTLIVSDNIQQLLSANFKSWLLFYRTVYLTFYHSQFLFLKFHSVGEWMTVAWENIKNRCK